MEKSWLEALPADSFFILNEQKVADYGKFRRFKK